MAEKLFEKQNMSGFGYRPGIKSRSRVVKKPENPGWYPGASLISILSCTYKMPIKNLNFLRRLQVLRKVNPKGKCQSVLSIEDFQILNLNLENNLLT